MILFQSTLPRRERQTVAGCGRPAANFNPRSREGSDHDRLILHHDLTISIHAPAKGATSFLRIPTCPFLFQSTLPRRERPYFINAMSFKFDFNPRSREGSDQKCFLRPCCLPRFQSTLPRRERLSVPRLSCGLQLFQSTLPRRERQHLLTSFRLQYGYFYFISPIKYSSCFKKIN